jgi:hypothetical protein
MIAHPLSTCNNRIEFTLLSSIEKKSFLHESATRVMKKSKNGSENYNMNNTFQCQRIHKKH